MLTLQTQAGDEGEGQAGIETSRPGFWLQTAVLTARAHKSVYRNLPIVLGLIIQGILLGVFIGVVFYKLPPVSSDNVPD